MQVSLSNTPEDRLAWHLQVPLLSEEDDGGGDVMVMADVDGARCRAHTCATPRASHCFSWPPSEEGGLSMPITWIKKPKCWGGRYLAHSHPASKCRFQNISPFTITPDYLENYPKVKSLVGVQETQFLAHSLPPTTLLSLISVSSSVSFMLGIS